MLISRLVNTWSMIFKEQFTAPAYLAERVAPAPEIPRAVRKKPGSEASTAAGWDRTYCLGPRSRLRVSSSRRALPQWRDCTRRLQSFGTSQLILGVSEILGGYHGGLRDVPRRSANLRAIQLLR